MGPSAVNFAGAQAYCEGVGADLVSVHSETEKDAVRALCMTQANACWIGLVLTDKTTWSWTDGSALDYGFDGSGAAKSPTVGLTPWHSGEPNDWKGAEDCVQISASTRGWNSDWNDAYCTSSGMPMCYGPLSAAAFEDVDDADEGAEEGLGDIELAAVLVACLLLLVGCGVAVRYCMKRKAGPSGVATFEAQGKEPEIEVEMEVDAQSPQSEETMQLDAAAI